MTLKEKSSTCRIAVDAMGGDFAPVNTVEGAIEALHAQPGFELFLIGDKNEILKVITEKGYKFSEENIIHTDEVIGMSDNPTNAIKTKPNSSIVVGAKLVKEGKVNAFVSAGNTGAMMAASTLLIGRIKGVGRPTIGFSMPTGDGGQCSIFDAGASVDSKPMHLKEYAILGSIYSKEMLGIKNPKIGVLSVGEEDSKGNEVSVKANQLIKELDLNFVGNVEGRDILNGSVDIVVCDGYVGNILLKFAESVPVFLKTRLTRFAKINIWNALKVLFMKGTLKKVLSDMDYQSYGGVPLLGVDGISIIGHGSSSSLAIKNMVLAAKEMFDKQLIIKFKEALAQYADK